MYRFILKRAQAFGPKYTQSFQEPLSSHFEHTQPEMYASLMVLLLSLLCMAGGLIFFLVDESSEAGRYCSDEFYSLRGIRNRQGKLRNL